MSSLARLAAILLVAATGYAAERTTAPAAPASEAPPATVGGKGGEPTAPVKGVEEPVFQLPELVIVGENQARIMAQKEQLAATPLKGLHEAPLLEKEEGTVTALRQREPVPGPAPLVAGRRGLVKLEGGSAGWLGGAGWYGVQRATGFMGGEVSGSRLTGVPVGSGHAGGWDAAGHFTIGEVMTNETRTGTGWSRWLANRQMDNLLLDAGVAGRVRDLPYLSPTARATLVHLWMSTDASDQPSNASGNGRINVVRVESPRGTVNADALALTRWQPLWYRGAWAVRARGRLEAEEADVAGSHFLPGGLLQVEWIPGERWRGEAGFNAEGVFGGGVFAGSFRPVGGLSWTMPAGPTVAARFAPAMHAPWVTSAARENPYAVFANRLVPERELANAEVSAWQGWRDGTQVKGTYRFIETRNAATWVERPGGLWEPAQVPGLRTLELAVEASMPIGSLNEAMAGSRWAVSAGGRWRNFAVSTGPAAGGSAPVATVLANVPRAAGTFGMTADWKTLQADLTADIVRWRPRTAVAGVAELTPYLDLGLGVTWKPVRWGQAFARVSNLAGSAVERWAGYPEPKALLRAGALVSF